MLDAQVLHLEENLLQDATQPVKAQLKAQLQRAQQSVNFQKALEARTHLAKLQEQASLLEKIQEQRNLLARIQENRSANLLRVRNHSANLAKAKISVARETLRREITEALARESSQAREPMEWLRTLTRRKATEVYSRTLLHSALQEQKLTRV